MTKNEWKRRCGQRLRDAGMDTGEAAAAAEACAWLEEQVSGEEVDQWDKPGHAADLHIASLDLKRDGDVNVTATPEAYNAALRTRLAAGRDPFRSVSQTEEE